MQAFVDQLIAVLGSHAPSVVGAITILIIGWIGAHVVAGMSKTLIHKSTLDAKLAGVFFPGDHTKPVDIQNWAGKTIFYFLMLLVLIAVFESLHLSQVNEPLNRLLSEVFQFFPRFVSAGLLLGVAWIIATLLRMIVKRTLEAARFDERFQDATQSDSEDQRALSSAISETLYWLILLLFLPAILGALAVEGLLDPVKGMTNSFLGMVPNLFAAGLILIVGWLLAGMLQRIVTNVSAAAGVDRASERVGLARVLGMQRASKVLGLVVYVLIFIPVLIGALDALQLDAITGPASNMLDTLLGVLPNLLGAGLMLLVAYVVGRVVSGLASNVLAGVGFNNIPVRLGLSVEAKAGSKTPSEIIGLLLLTTIVLFAFIEAADQLGLQLLADLVADFTIFGGHLFVGLVVLTIGLYLANLAAKAIQASGVAQASFIAKAARAGIIVLATAMALQQMGLADEIVNLAFGLSLGSLAVAFALAFGLGGREVAGTELREWIQRLKAR